MEKETLNSCIMLAANFDVPVDLGCVFDDADLKDTGIELDSHITLLYAQSQQIPREDLLDDIKTILGEHWEDFFGYIKSEESMPVFDVFELGNFGNDSDYVVLKMKKSFQLYDMLSMINKGLRVKYGVVPTFKDYTPHMTLAELEAGCSKKYMESEELGLILSDSFIGFEDLMISYGTDNEVEDRKQYFLTHEKCVDRYFRLENLKKLHKELTES